jgi:hypothetical protein
LSFLHECGLNNVATKKHYKDFILRFPVAAVRILGELAYSDGDCAPKLLIKIARRERPSAWSLSVRRGDRAIPALNLLPARPTEVPRGCNLCG